jgi:hypothetical protein
MIKILNEAFSNYWKDKELLKFQLVAYAQAFPYFVVPPFVAPSLARTPCITRYGKGLGFKVVLLDPKDMIQSKREDNVKIKKLSRPVLKSCNFISKIKLYQFWDTNQFYVYTNFTFLLVLG